MRGSIYEISRLGLFKKQKTPLHLNFVTHDESGVAENITKKFKNRISGYQLFRHPLSNHLTMLGKIDSVSD